MWVRFFRRIVEVVKTTLVLEAVQSSGHTTTTFCFKIFKEPKFLGGRKVLWLELCNSAVYFGSRNIESKMHVPP